MCNCGQKQKYPIDVLSELKDIANILDDHGAFHYADRVSNVMKRISQVAANPAQTTGTAPTVPGTNPQQPTGGSTVDFGDGPFVTNDPDLIEMYPIYAASSKDCPGSPPNGLPPALLDCLSQIPMTKPHGGGNYTPVELSGLSMECLLQTIGGWVGRGTSLGNPGGSVGRAKSVGGCFSKIPFDPKNLQSAAIKALCQLIVSNVGGGKILIIIMKKAGIDIAKIICSKLA